MTDADKSHSSRIAFLDWLRIFAFLSVFAGHEYGAAYVAAMNNPALQASLRLVMQAIYPFISSGGAGVVVFFLVSGYVIASVLERESTGMFLVRRVFRIYPLYVVAVLLELALGAPFPGWAVLLQQFSLFGEGFHTPYTLRGVEWTLRTEVLFYAYMAVLKMAGLIDGRWSRALPVVLVGSIACLYFLLEPVPGQWSWSYAYLNLYAPFLLLGTYFFLCEKRRVDVWSCVAVSAFVLLVHWILLPQWQPRYRESYFVIAAFPTFVVMWGLRTRIRIGVYGLAISELTYAVYLFHAWLYPSMFGLIEQAIAYAPLAHALTFAALLLVCALFVRLIEKPMIQLGRRLSNRLRKAPAQVASANSVA